MAHVVNQSFQLKEHVTVPLMPDCESNFRLFLGDTREPGDVFLAPDGVLYYDKKRPLGRKHRKRRQIGWQSKTCMIPMRAR